GRGCVGEHGAARHADYQARGLTDAQLVEQPWGDTTLTVHDPDGYTLGFLSFADLPPDQALALYLQGPAALDAALAGLDPADLDRAPQPGAWTIRQIVHHIVDGDNLWTLPIRVALGSPGAVYNSEWYSPDNAWAETLNYAGRPIEAALALFRANRPATAELL